MAHYAFLNENNIVTEVIVGKNENDDGVDWEAHYGVFRGQTCKRTSYNTHGGQHPENRPLRKNYAGVGYTYDSGRDAFIPPQPYPSWVMSEETCLWSAPVERPIEGGAFIWNEETLNWINL